MSRIVLAFKGYNYHDGIFGSPWVGLENPGIFFQSGKGVDDDAGYGALQYRVFASAILQIVCAVLLSELAGKYFKRIAVG